MRVRVRVRVRGKVRVSAYAQREYLDLEPVVRVEHALLGCEVRVRG